MDSSRYIARPSAPTVIVLHEVLQDRETFEFTLNDCLFEQQCGSSYNAYYSLETGAVIDLPANQASLTWMPVTIPNPECPGVDNKCCNFPTTSPFYQTAVDANLYTYNVAVKLSSKFGLGCPTQCSADDIASLAAAVAKIVASIKETYPAFVLSVANLIKPTIACCGKQLACLTDETLEKIVQEANIIVSEPVPTPTSPFCFGLKSLTPGVIAKVAGLDILGNCVIGDPSVAAAAPSVITGFTATPAGLSLSIDGGTPVVVPWAAIGSLLPAPAVAFAPTPAGLSLSIAGGAPVVIPWVDIISDLKNDPSLVTIEDAFGVPQFKVFPL